MNKVLSEISKEERCIPWYYPLVDPALRLCSPFEARDFSVLLDNISHDDCKVWINYISMENGIIKRVIL